MNRRQFWALGALAGVSALAMTRGALATEGEFEIERTPEEWRAMLTDLQYNVMREEGTERAGSSPLDRNYVDGTYHCRGCDLALYGSDAKFDSGTGWPSFYQSLPRAIGTTTDTRFFMTRTEAHCRRCGSHLGHIFDDGPAPTGKRHCLNGVALVFRAA